MDRCVKHETEARKARAPVGLVFKPCVYFHAAGSDKRSYSIDYDNGAFVEGTSYEYPAWMEEIGKSTPLGTWSALKDAIIGCSENETAMLAEASRTTGEGADGG